MNTKETWIPWKEKHNELIENISLQQENKYINNPDEKLIFIYKHIKGKLVDMNKNQAQKWYYAKKDICLKTYKSNQNRWFRQ